MCPVWRNSARNEVPETSTIGPDEDGTGNDGWSMDSWFYGDNSSQPNDNRYGGIIIEEPDSIDRRIPYNEDNRGLGNKGVKKVFGYGGFLVSFGDTGPQYRSGVHTGSFLNRFKPTEDLNV